MGTLEYAEVRKGKCRMRWFNDYLTMLRNYL